MALDFPGSPSVGQKFPSSPIVGIPSYTWDGEKWTTAVGTASGGLAVLYDKAQSLTALNQQQARQNIYAAPFDAMAYGGLQINGGMEVSQERGTGITSAIGSYICDGWKFFYSGTMVVNGAIASAAGWFAGFPSLLYMTAGVAQTTIGAADYALLQQFIEGYRIARLQWGTANAQPITIGFWSAHHRPGLYSGVVRNGANNRTYAFTYTQAAADVAQYNVITVPGDTAGTWAADNTTGLVLYFCIGLWQHQHRAIGQCLVGRKLRRCPRPDQRRRRNIGRSSASLASPSSPAMKPPAPRARRSSCGVMIRSCGSANATTARLADKRTVTLA